MLLLGQMSKFRIIPTILTDGYRVLKGKNFDSSRPVGILEPLINVYESRDIDELVILDTKATHEGRTFNPSLIISACSTLSIPLSIGGGFKDIHQIEMALNNGADKVVIGAASLTNKDLVKKASTYFGSQCLVGSLDLKLFDTDNIYINSGRTKLRIDPLSAATELESMGIGEILLQIIDKEGTLSGISLDIASSILEKVNIPVVYSGGISSNQDFLEIAQRGFSGAAAGALFQFTENTPNSVREFLDQNNISVRKSLRYT
jgi:cyclase